MREAAFESFQCDKPVSLGLNLEALSKTRGVRFLASDPW